MGDKETAIPFNEKLGSLTQKLNDGNVIPQIGLGTYLHARAVTYFKPSKKEQSEDDKQEQEFKNAVLVAIKNGYRHIDTAQIYRTERIIADALKELYAQNVIKREDLFITTKVARDMRKPQQVRDSIDRSLKELNVDYIDMILIHSPHTDNKEGKRGHDVIEIYKILHEYRSKGKIKSIGVSNFGIEQLKILKKACPKLPLPVVNQIECNPFLQEEELIEYCTSNGILIQ